MSSSPATLSKCVVCEKIPAEVALSCDQNHTICRRCVPKIEADETQHVKCGECSICQQSLLNPELTKFRYLEPFRCFEGIQEFLKPARPKTCEIPTCSASERNADYHCSDCDIHLCESCIDSHIPTAKDAAKHRLFSIQESGAKPTEIKCSHCCDAVATQYCAHGKCNAAICFNCVHRGHEQHNVIELNRALKFQIESIEKHNLEMRRRGESLKVRMSGLERLKDESLRDVDRVSARVQETASRLRAIIDRDEADICREIGMIKNNNEDMFQHVLHDIAEKVDKFDLIERVHSNLKEADDTPFRTLAAFAFINANVLTGDHHQTDSIISQLHARQPFDLVYKPNPAYQVQLEELSKRTTNAFGGICKRLTLEETASLDVKSERGMQVTGMDINDQEQIAISDRHGVISLYGFGGHINHIHDFRMQITPESSAEIQDIAFRPNGNLLVNNFPAGVVLEVTTTGKIVQQFRLTWPKSTWNPLGICINWRSEVAVTFIGTCTETSKKAFSLHILDWDTQTVTKSRTLDFSPRYICPLDDGGYAISDYISHSVYFLNPKLKVRFVYPGSAGLKSPSGLCCLPNGNVLITERENCTVHEVSPSGNYKRVLLTERNGLRSPKAVACTENGDVIVADEQGDLIKAYRYHSMGKLKIA